MRPMTMDCFSLTVISDKAKSSPFGKFAHREITGYAIGLIEIYNML